MIKRVTSFILIIGFMILNACSSAASPPSTQAPTVPPPGPSAAPILPSPTQPGASSLPAPQSSPDSPSSSPAKPSTAQTTTPLPPGFVSGYWVHNTQQDGLCTDSPRFIGPAPSGEANLIGTGGKQVCLLDQVALPDWVSCGPDPFYDFVPWQSTSIDALEVVNASDVFADEACHKRPALAGIGGRCIFRVTGELECQTSADGLPFDQIIGYGVDVRGADGFIPDAEYTDPKKAADPQGVEWFLSADRLASYHLAPKDVDLSLKEVFGAGFTRATWLSVPDQEGESLWVGSQGAGLLVIDPITGKPLAVFQDELPGKSIYAVQSAASDCVWVGADGGAAFWDGNIWRTYTTADGLPGDKVYGISTETPTECDVVWAATDGGPARLQVGSDRWQAFPDFPQDWQLFDAMLGEFATRGQGLLRFVQAPTVSGEFRQFTVQDGLPDLQVTALAQSTSDSILVGTPKGAAEWDGTSWKILAGEPVNDLSSTMIATQAGLWFWQENAWQKVSNDPVSLLAEGGWYATDAKVCRWADGKAACPQTDQGADLAGATALALEAQSGHLFVVDEKNHIWVYQDAGQFVPHNIDIVYGPMTSLLATPDGLFFGNHKGFYLEYPGELSATWADYTLANGWRVRLSNIQLSPEKDAIWIATNQGVFSHAFAHGQDLTSWMQPWSEEIPPTWTYLAGLPTRLFTQVLPLPDGELWLGAQDQGLFQVQLRSR
jgi:hypothetical protein